MHCNDLPNPTWRKSTYSGNSGNCVEVAATKAWVAVRDSKDREGRSLVVASQQWTGFVRAMRKTASRVGAARTPLAGE
jgi:hypothetical protein